MLLYLHVREFKKFLEIIFLKREGIWFLLLDTSIKVCFDHSENNDDNRFKMSTNKSGDCSIKLCRLQLFCRPRLFCPQNKMLTETRCQLSRMSPPPVEFSSRHLLDDFPVKLNQPSRFKNIISKNFLNSRTWR